jgi:exodeoxyribonuclease V beta subunit
LLRLLYDWRGLAESGDFETLFARIVDDSGIVCRELFFRDSERSLTNYLHLLEILQEEAARTRATIRELGQTLGAYILNTRRPPGEARDIQRLETEADAVQIMTIHHSKGLEAPVIFLYGGFWTPPGNDVRGFHDGPPGQARRVVRVGRQPTAEEGRYKAEQDDEERRVLYVALTRAKARLYLPRFPVSPNKVFGQLKGCYRFVQERLDGILNGITPPEVRALFHRVAVPCPATDPLGLAPAPAATLQAWDPPARLLADDDSGAIEATRALGAARAGFVLTSYSAVKGRHGGFVPADPIEGGADPTSSDGDSSHLPPAAPDPLPPDVLPRGRLSGRFLHEVLEELPLATLAARPPLDRWAALPEVEALFERKRRRHDRETRHVPHARRLIYDALTLPIALGQTRIAGLASAARVLREMEFLYPIPERAHPLLGRAEADADGSGFTIQRGVVKGFIDLLFEHQGRSYVCDWKGDWLPSWKPAAVAVHCERNYGIQARLYTLGTLRWLGITDAAGYEARFGGVLYCFLRGLDADDPGAGVYFHRPDWAEVLAWQTEMLDAGFWRLS